MIARLSTRLAFVAALATAAGSAVARPQEPANAPIVFDRAVAVVNQHVILASDIEDEVRLSVLDPNLVGRGALTPQGALDQLISRALIEQQMGQEDAEAATPSQKSVDAHLIELRKDLPACVHENCASEAGWQAFLDAHGLTPERVDAYLTYRLEILSFIELRFRPAINITQQQIEDYYRNTLLPQYAAGEKVPPLEEVSSRIEEILLQQQVNALFDQWLTNLRRQGDVEVLDSALEDPDAHGGLPNTAAQPGPAMVKP